MVEGINKTQPLIKKLLRLTIVRGNRVMEIAQTGNQPDRVGLRMVGMILRSYAPAQYGSS